MAEKDELKNIKPVVKIDQTKVRKSTGRQFFSSLVTRDFGTIWDYLIDPDDGIVTNAVRALCAEVGCSVISMIFRQGPKSNGGSRRWNSQPTNYGSIYRTSDTGIFKYGEQKSYETKTYDARRSSIDYMDIQFNNRADAERVLESMRDILEQYPSVSVANFYDLVGYNYENNWTCHDFGWTDLSDVIVSWSHGAWIIALPKAVPIK